MLTKKVSVSRGCTVNLGNFESKRADFSMEVELETGEDAMVTYNKIMHMLKLKIADFVNSQDGAELPFS